MSVMPARPLRIVYFVAEYHRVTGSQQTLLHLIRHLPRETVEPLVLFPREGMCVQAFREAEIPVRVIPAPSQLDLFGQVLLRIPSWQKARLLWTEVLPYAKQVADFLKTYRADLLHCNTLRAILLAGYAAKLRKIPLIWHNKGRLVGDIWLRFAGQILASRIILISETLRSDISAPFQKKCVTIYDGIDRQAIRGSTDGDDNLKLPPECDGRQIVAAFSSIGPAKGYHHLLKAAHLVNQQLGEKRPVFLIVGELLDEAYRRYLEHLESLVREYKLDNVFFIGMEPPLAYYQAADVVVFPSIEEEVLSLDGHQLHVKSGEGLPRVITEAMLMAKPVVAARVAGVIEQVIDGETGLTVPPSDPEALAQALIKLLASGQLRQQMGQRASERVRQHFSTEQMVRETVSLYQEFVS